MKSLISIAPPPKAPVGAGTLENWEAVEQKWKTSFPQDYKLFINTYGNGRFTDFFGFPSPFFVSPRGSSFELFVKQRIEGVKFSQQNMPKHAASLPVYPESRGLFPIGYTDNGGTIFFLMEGDFNTWPIVCMKTGHTKDFERFRLPLSHFIEGWLTKKFEVVTLTPPDFFPLRNPVFIPTPS